MRLYSVFKTAVIIALFFSCFTVNAQFSTPFISQLEGLSEGKEVKITMINGIVRNDYSIQYRLKSTTKWIESPEKIKRSGALGEATLTGLESNKSYCFRIIQRDSVNHTETISNQACSISLKPTLLSSKNVRLQWSKIDSTDRSLTTIVVMEENGNNVNKLNFGQISDTTFIYNELSCSTRFKFSVVMTSSIVDNGVVKNTLIQSPQILVETKSLLIPPNLQSIDIAAVDLDNQPFYNVHPLVQMPKYEFYRSINGGEMIKVGEGKDELFTDKNLDVERNYYCYAHKYINECGNTSELSRKNCTIKMTSEPSGKFTWSPFRIYADTNLCKVLKTEYIFQIIDSLKNTIESLNPILDTTISIEAKYSKSAKYRVLSRSLSYINLGLETRTADIASYSNLTGAYLILGNESPKNTLAVFPNPTENKIRISSFGVPIRFVELIDVSGRVIHKGEILEDSFDLSGFEKGKYILRLYDTNKKLLNTKNIVKW